MVTLRMVLADSIAWSPPLDRFVAELWLVEFALGAPEPWTGQSVRRARIEVLA